VTTLNYSAIANLHISQITTAHAKPSQFAVSSSFPATASNNRDASASVLMSLLSGEYPTTELNSKLVILMTPWHGPRRKHRLQQFLYCCMWIRWRWNMFDFEGVTQERLHIFAY
jgi:hypothetical protein